MYTFDAIILEKQALQEKKIRITVLSKDFGKITVWSHKPVNGADIGDIAQIVLKRNNNINTLRSISTKSYLINKNWDFSTLYAFLYIVKTLSFCTNDEQSATAIFCDYQTTIRTQKNITLDQCLLLHMRIFRHLGSLNPKFFDNDPALRYIYQHITTTPLQKILCAKPLKETHKITIQKANQFSFSVFL